MAMTSSAFSTSRRHSSSDCLRPLARKSSIIRGKKPIPRAALGACSRYSLRSSEVDEMTTMGAWAMTGFDFSSGAGRLLLLSSRKATALVCEAPAVRLYNFQVFRNMKRSSLPSLTLVCVIALAAHAADRDDLKSRTGWPAYNGGFDSLHYSSLKQINRKNVAQLRVAWTYDTGDAFRGSEFECNPIVVNGVLYATTPKLRVIALDAATGKQKWSFDPHAGARVQVK